MKSGLSILVPMLTVAQAKWTISASSLLPARGERLKDDQDDPICSYRI